MAIANLHLVNGSLTAANFLEHGRPGARIVDNTEDGMVEIEIQPEDITSAAGALLMGLNLDLGVRINDDGGEEILTPLPHSSVPVGAIIPKTDEAAQYKLREAFVTLAAVNAYYSHLQFESGEQLDLEALELRNTFLGEGADQLDPALIEAHELNSWREVAKAARQLNA